MPLETTEIDRYHSYGALRHWIFWKRVNIRRDRLVLVWNFCFESSIQNDISFSNHVERLFRIDNASNYRTKCVRFIIQKHHIIITSKSHHNHIILWNIDICFVFKLQTIAMVTKWYSMAKKMNDSFKFSDWEFYYVKCFILFSFDL